MENDIKEKDWEEFRKSGLLWFINSILHTFGWAICMEPNENDDSVRVYPARVKFRGFSEKSNDRGYQRVTEYLKQNIDELQKEVEEGMEE